MTKSVREQVSALMDGELDAWSRRRTIDAVLTDEGLLRQWERGHLMREALSNNLPAGLDLDFARRVAQAIDAEPLASGPMEGEPGSWGWRTWRPAGAFAVAAVAALVAIVAVPPLLKGERQAEPGAQIALTPTPSPSPSPSLSPQDFATLSATHQPVPRPRLNQYFVSDIENAAITRVQGVLPYARILGQRAVYDE